MLIMSLMLVLFLLCLLSLVALLALTIAELQLAAILFYELATGDSEDLFFFLLISEGLGNIIFFGVFLIFIGIVTYLCSILIELAGENVTMMASFATSGTPLFVGERILA